MYFLLENKVTIKKTNYLHLKKKKLETMYYENY